MRNFYNFLIILENIFLVCVLTFAIPIPVSLIYSEYYYLRIFIILLILFLVLFAFLRITRKYFYNVKINLKSKNSIFIISFSWIIICIIGSLPYFCSGTDTNFFNALFESVSGWTTTGSTLMEHETFSYTIFFYRGLVTYFGGLGIIIFMGIIINMFGYGISGMLFNESKSLDISNKNINHRSEIKYFLLIYFSLTVIQILLLVAFKAKVFNAILLTFASISTGGIALDFGDLSIPIKIICSVFSILGALNFIGYILLIKRNIKEFLKGVELRYFALIIIFSTIIISITLYFSKITSSILDALTMAFFETVSFITTTGFLADDYSNWPRVTILILFVLSIIGGCSNSTSSSLKVIRVVTLANILKRNILKRINNKRIIQVRVGSNVISSDQATNIVIFFLIFIICFTAGTFLMSLEGHSLSFSAQASISAISNTGLSFSDAKVNLASSFTDYGKVIYSILMLLGRLEFFALIIIFIPSYFRK